MGVATPFMHAPVVDSKNARNDRVRGVTQFVVDPLQLTRDLCLKRNYSGSAFDGGAFSRRHPRPACAATQSRRNDGLTGGPVEIYRRAA